MMTLNRCMTDLTSVAAVALMAGGVSFAQVMAPAEIKDPKLRALQSKHQAELTAAAAEMAAPQYPAKFYLTRELDLRSDALISADRRSIVFSIFGTQTVLRVKVNYAAVYPTETPSKDRVSRTYLDVVVPVLTAATKGVQDESEMDAVDIEIPRYVRKVTATVYIDGKGVPFDGQAPATVSQRPAARTPAPVAAPVPPPSKEALDQRQMGLQPVLDRMVQELGPQAHFDPLAKPALTAFRGGTYLKVPVVTTLTAANVGSQYRLAALAFDRHVAHLVRLPYFKSASGFEGITFRTTVSAGASPAESVEFLFPLAELRRYENDDC